MTSPRGKIVSINGMEMHYEEYGEEHRAGLPVVLLHGFGGCTQNWHPFVAELAKHLWLIAVDLRGHGYSTNPGNTFTHKQAASDAFRLLDTLGIDRFSAMGMSTGGMALLHMATNQPQRIEAMVLISATTHFPEQARAIMKRASYATMPREVQAMYSACAKRGEEQIHQLITQFNALHANHDDMNFTSQDLSTITARTLVVHGARDNFFSTEIVESMSRSIPNAELWVIPSGEHVPIFDATVPFTATALRFLEKP